MSDEGPGRIDATFRNGSITAVSVVVGFSLTFLNRWAGLPGQWHRIDLVAVALIVPGIALQVGALANLLRVGTLVLARYDRAITVFLAGLALVALGIGVAIVGDVTGYGQHVLGG